MTRGLKRARTPDLHPAPEQRKRRMLLDGTSLPTGGDLSSSEELIDDTPHLSAASVELGSAVASAPFAPGEYVVPRNTGLWAPRITRDSAISSFKGSKEDAKRLRRIAKKTRRKSRHARFEKPLIERGSESHLQTPQERVMQNGEGLRTNKTSINHRIAAETGIQMALPMVLARTHKGSDETTYRNLKKVMRNAVQAITDDADVADELSDYISDIDSGDESSDLADHAAEIGSRMTDHLGNLRLGDSGQNSRQSNRPDPTTNSDRTRIRRRDQLVLNTVEAALAAQYRNPEFASEATRVPLDGDGLVISSLREEPREIDYNEQDIDLLNELDAGYEADVEDDGVP